VNHFGGLGNSRVSTKRFLKYADGTLESGGGLILLVLCVAIRPLRDGLIVLARGIYNPNV